MIQSPGTSRDGLGYAMAKTQFAAGESVIVIAEGPVSEYPMISIETIEKDSAGFRAGPHALPSLQLPCTVEASRDDPIQRTILPDTPANRVKFGLL